LVTLINSAVLVVVAPTPVWYVELYPFSFIRLNARPHKNNTMIWVIFLKLFLLNYVILYERTTQIFWFLLNFCNKLNVGRWRCNSICCIGAKRGLSP
jgi:hypothetical protein